MERTFQIFSPLTRQRLSKLKHEIDTFFLEFKRNGDLVQDETERRQELARCSSLSKFQQEFDAIFLPFKRNDDLLQEETERRHELVRCFAEIRVKFEIFVDELRATPLPAPYDEEQLLWKAKKEVLRLKRFDSTWKESSFSKTASYIQICEHSELCAPFNRPHPVDHDAHVLVHCIYKFLNWASRIANRSSSEHDSMEVTMIPDINPESSHFLPRFPVPFFPYLFIAGVLGLWLFLSNRHTRIPFFVDLGLVWAWLVSWPKYLHLLHFTSYVYYSANYETVQWAYLQLLYALVRTNFGLIVLLKALCPNMHLKNLAHLTFETTLCWIADLAGLVWYRIILFVVRMIGLSDDLDAFLKRSFQFSTFGEEVQRSQKSRDEFKIYTRYLKVVCYFSFSIWLCVLGNSILSSGLNSILVLRKALFEHVLKTCCVFLLVLLSLFGIRLSMWVCVAMTVRKGSRIYQMSSLNPCLALAMGRSTGRRGTVVYLGDLLLTSDHVYETRGELYVKIGSKLLEITHDAVSAHASMYGVFAASESDRVSNERLLELILSGRHKIVGRDFLPANGDTWMVEGRVSREELLDAVWNSGHSVTEAANLVDSCLRANGNNQRAALQWLSYHRWSKSRAGMAVLYNEQFNKIRIERNGLLVRESLLHPFWECISTFLFGQPAEDEKYLYRENASAELERFLIASGCDKARSFIDQRNFVFSSPETMSYGRGKSKIFERREAYLTSLIKLTASARLEPGFVEVIVPPSEKNLYVIPPPDRFGSGNIWEAVETLPVTGLQSQGYNITGALVNRRIYWKAKKISHSRPS